MNPEGHFTGRTRRRPPTHEPKAKAEHLLTGRCLCLKIVKANKIADLRERLKHSSPHTTPIQSTLFEEDHPAIVD